MLHPKAEPADQSDLLSSVTALLKEHHESLITHIETCVSSAVMRSITTDDKLVDLRPAKMSMRSTSSLSSLLAKEDEKQNKEDQQPGAETSQALDPEVRRRSGSMTMSERDEFERGLAVKYHEEETEIYKASTTHSELHEPTAFSWLQDRIRYVVELRKFEIVCAVLILLNSVIIGAEIQMNIDNPGHDRSAFFVVAQCIFCLIFMLELLLRMTAEGFCTFFCQSPHLLWNFADLFIIICMIIEVAIQLIITFGDDYDSNQVRGVSNVRLLRILRVCRLIRTLRMIRVVRFVRDLRLLMNSIFSTLYALGWSMMLLMMIIYVFAIVFTQESSDYLIQMDPQGSMAEESFPIGHVRLYFGTLPKSMFTLFKSISDGISWHGPVEALGQISIVCVGMFVIFVAFVYFAVLNVVTGVFCTSAIESSLKDHEHAVHMQIKSKKAWQKKMEALFKTIDVDGSSMINIKEFEQGLQNARVKAYMASMELDPDDAWTLFKLLDTDSTQSVDVEEFVLGCLRLRGPARSLDVAKLIYDTRMMAKRQECFMDFVESQLQRLALYSHYTAGTLKHQHKGTSKPNGSHQRLPPPLATVELDRSRGRSQSKATSGDRALYGTEGDDLYGVLSAPGSPQASERPADGIRADIPYDAANDEIAGDPCASAPEVNVNPRAPVSKVKIQCHG